MNKQEFIRKILGVDNVFLEEIMNVDIDKLRIFQKGKEICFHCKHWDVLKDSLNGNIYLKPFCNLRNMMMRSRESCNKWELVKS